LFVKINPKQIKLTNEPNIEIYVYKCFLHKGLFDNTALFLYSDHGPRFTDKRSRNNRYIEERLPFFAIYLPQWFKQKYPAKLNNLKVNSNLLTTPFDIYATIRELTCLKPLEKNHDFPMRSISLLEKINLKRSCDSIPVSDHYCACVQNWISVKISDPKIKEAVLFAIQIINQITSSQRSVIIIS